MAREAELKGRITMRDDTKKGVDSAKTNLQDFIAGAAKVVAVVYAMKKVADAVIFVNNAFLESEKALNRLTNAARNNPLLSGSWAGRFAEYASQLQYVVGVEDEAIVNQAAFAASLGRTDEEIRKITQAAANWAATGQVTFETAFQQLTRTYSGMAGQIGRLIPGMKDLTEAQLKQGVAVDFVAKKFDGMAEASLRGLEGSRRLAAISFDELKESIGQYSGTVEKFFNRAFASVSKILTDELNKGFNNADPDAWFRQLFADLIVFGTRVQEFFQNIFFGIQRMSYQVMKALTDLTGNQAASAIYEKLISNATRQIGSGASEALAKAVSMYQGGGTAEQSLAYMRSQMGQQGVNQLMLLQAITQFRWIITLLPKETRSATRAGLLDAADGLGDAIGAKLSFFDQFNTFGKEVGKRLAQIVNGDTGVFAKFGRFIDDSRIARGAAQIGKALAGATGGGGGTAFEDTMNTIGGVVSGNLLPLIQNLINSLGPIGVVINIIITFLSKFEQFSAVFTNFMDGLVGGLGEVVNEVFQPLAEVMSTLGEVVGQILVPVFEFLAPIVQFVATMIGFVARLLQPFSVFLNAILVAFSPFLQILTALSPIIEIIAKAFIILYNFAIMPLGNAVIFVIKIITDIVAFFYNAVSFIVRMLTFGLVNMGTMAYSDWSSGWLAPISELSTSSTASAAEEIGAGGAAQYTQGRTINIYVTVNTDVLVGEGGIRDLAMIIKKEIRSAEALGVA